MATEIGDGGLMEEWLQALALGKEQLGVTSLRKVVINSTVRWASFAHRDPHSSHPLTFEYQGGSDPSITIIVSSYVRSWRRGELRELLCFASVVAHVWLVESIRYDWIKPSESHIQLCKYLGCDYKNGAQPSDRHEHINAQHRASYITRYVDDSWPKCTLCEKPLHTDDPELIHRGCEYYLRTVVIPKYKASLQQSNVEG